MDLLFIATLGDFRHHLEEHRLTTQLLLLPARQILFVCSCPTQQVVWVRLVWVKYCLPECVVDFFACNSAVVNDYSLLFAICHCIVRQHCSLRFLIKLFLAYLLLHFESLQELDWAASFAN